MIAVTGARGSIGSALMDELRRTPEVVMGFDIEEWDIRRPYRNPMLDQSVTMTDFEPRLVYHLAAAKDAPEGEVDPLKVLEINAVGTRNVLARWPEAKVVLASTCKACDPETAYGASKLIAERMVLNAGGVVARFHNVVQTRGNVFETWERIPADEPIPATDCLRYFIDIDQAVDLLLWCGRLPSGRYLAHPGGQHRMVDVAKGNYPHRPIRVIPRRRGDREIEPFVASHETAIRGEAPAPGHIWTVRSHHDA